MPAKKTVKAATPKKTTVKASPKKNTAKASSHRPTIITFLLDESGSMGSIINDTIGGFNTYISEQKKLEGRLDITLVKFDTINPYNVVYKDKPIKDVAILTTNDYKPNGGTPLIDAAYEAITTAELSVKDRKDKPIVMVVIQTDGEENSSTKHTMAQLKALIETKQSQGWVFVFMGAGINAYTQGSAMGISQMTTSSYARGQSTDAFKNLSVNTVSMRSSGSTASMNYSAQQLQGQGDSYATNPDSRLGGSLSGESLKAKAVKK